MNEQSSPVTRSLMDDAFCWDSVSTLRLGGTVFRLAERVEPVKGCNHGVPGGTPEVILRCVATQEERRAQLSELLRLYGSGDLEIIDYKEGQQLIELLTRNDAERKILSDLPLAGRSLAEHEATATRIRWLHALKERGFQEFAERDLTSLEITFIAEQCNLPVVTARTLARWSDEYARGKVIPNFRERGGAGQVRTDLQAHRIFYQVLAEARSDELRTTPLTPTAMHGAVHSVVLTENETLLKKIEMFSVSTVGRLLSAELSPLEKFEAKHGPAAAKRYAQATGARSKTGVVGAITEFDDMDSKVFCIGRNGLGWGRPFITSGVDQASAYPTGRSFGKQHRSAVSAIECIINSIVPKEPIPNPEGKPIVIHAYGVGTQGVFDNALYNDERIVTLGVDLQDPCWTRPFKPLDKREVEYLNRETTAWLRTEPGFKGPKGDQDALKAGIATAVWTFEQLRDRHAIWLWGKYANRPMRDGLTRAQKYCEEGALAFRAKLPPDMRRLNLLRLVPLKEPIRWGPNGIRYGGLTYHDIDLFRLWISRHGGSMRVKVRIDPHRLEVMYVEVPDQDKVLELFCHQIDYARGMTHYQHKQVLKICTQLKLRNPNLKQMYEAEDLLRTNTAQWTKSGKVRERAKAERTGDLPIRPAKTVAVSEVEQGYDDIASVTMSEEDAGFLIPEEV